jgi:hypothetical protein
MNGLRELLLVIAVDGCVLAIALLAIYGLNKAARGR